MEYLIIFPVSYYCQIRSRCFSGVYFLVGKDKQVNNVMGFNYYVGGSSKEELENAEEAATIILNDMVREIL